MGVVIHDDMWQAAQQLPEKQRGEFLLAICNYGFEGVEPKGSPPWLFGFTLVKDRIQMGNKASEKGRVMARARWGKSKAQASSTSDAQASTQHDATAYAQASCTDDATAMHTAYAEDEVEVEVEYEDNPLYPPFWMQCLKALNEELGTPYTHMPSECRRNLENHKDQYTVEQVAAMVRYMRKERSGTRFKNTLTPNTLFSLDHFEQYMHMAEGEEKEAEEYAVYDR